MSNLFGSKGPQNPHMLVGSGLPKEVADVRADVDEAFTDLENGGLYRTDEFTNPVAASATYIKGSTATTTSASKIAATALTHATIPSGAREVTLARSSATGAYVAGSKVVVHGKAYGKKRTLTFTLPDANGGDTVTSAEREGLDEITSVDVDAQASTAGAFTLGISAALGLRGAPRSRAGMLNVLKEIVDGAAVTTGSFSDRSRLYTPATAPNGAHDYAVTFEVDPAV